MVSNQLHQFQIQLTPEITIQGEYEGNPVKGAVILSHGFGVRRDSRGMFTELSQRLQASFLVIKFDYTLIDETENTTRVYSLRTQAHMLAKVIEFVRNELYISVIQIVCHSQGGVVAALLAPEKIQKVVLIAASTISSYQRNLQRFRNRPGSVLNEQGISKLARSDGSFTYIPAEFFEDIKNIQPLTLFAKLAQKTDLYYMAALQDDVLVGEDVTRVREIPGITYLELDGDHNFTGSARPALLHTLAKILNT